MKHMLSIPKRFKVLPIVIATSITLAGCGADSTGEINGGIDTGFGGGVGANGVLLAAGVVGLATILADSSDSSTGTPTVGVESGNNTDDGNGGDGTDNGGDNTGDGTDNGGDNTGDGTDNGGDNTGDGTDNGGDNTGDGTDNGGDNTGDGGDNTDGGDDNGNDAGTGVSVFQPPAWLNGMWRGTNSSGEDQVAFATAADIGLGPNGAVASYSAIPGITVTELQNSDSVYQYTVSYPGANGNVSFTETWTSNGDGSLLYSVSGDINDEFIMYQVAATDFIAPPAWLQGDWEGNDYRASVSSGNISLGPVGATSTNLFDVASAPGSIVRVVTDTAADYQIQVISNNNGMLSTVDYRFGIFDENSITFSSSALKTTVVMIRQ